MGLPAGTAGLGTQVSAEYTSTRTTFVITVQSQISMNVTFVSPINPTDFKRQSLTGAYLYVSVTSIDGASHAVQLYSDTTGGMYCYRLTNSCLHITDSRCRMD